MFVIPCHALIDIVNRGFVPFKTKFLNKRLVSLCDNVTPQDNDNARHDLPIQILNLARKRPKKV